MARRGSGSSSRVDTLEIKALIIRKVGHHRAEQYLDQLRKLFSLKISKFEFDEFCVRTIGRENIPLHNLLIRSIVKNACLPRVSPQQNSVKARSTFNAKISIKNHRNGFQTPCVDAFHSSRHNGRSHAGRDCKLEERPSPLGPLGKPQSITFDDSTSKVQERQSATELHSLGSRPPASVEDGEEVEQMAGSPCVQSRSSVTAPLGISMNFCTGPKSLSSISLSSKHYSETCHSRGELPDTASLRNRLQQRLEMEDLGVTMDCVNLLNNALDSYLKRLIESSMSLAGSRCGNKCNRQQHGHFIMGSNALMHRRYVQTEKESMSISLLDFRIAMELNPQILGGDWALLLEKISMHH